jgi:adenine-specific DNA-methyltransferase
LLNVPDVDEGKLPAAVRRYILFGEDAKFHEGYKCSIRKHWFVVPSRWIPEGFLFRQIHEYPKLVLNETGAECTDTIHRMRFREGIDGKQVAVSFLNSLTFAFSEVMGRSYGGGVLELEPNEADNLPIPYFPDAGFDVDILDGLERAGDVNTILDITDRVLLSELLGYSRDEIQMFRGIWRKLSQRRVGRKSKRAKTVLANT